MEDLYITLVTSAAGLSLILRKFPFLTTTPHPERHVQHIHCGCDRSFRSLICKGGLHDFGEQYKLAWNAAEHTWLRSLLLTAMARYLVRNNCLLSTTNLSNSVTMYLQTKVCKCRSQSLELIKVMRCLQPNTYRQYLRRKDQKGFTGLPKLIAQHLLSQLVCLYLKPLRISSSQHRSVFRSCQPQHLFPQASILFFCKSRMFL